MWKFVSRRLRDTVDRTYNALGVTRASSSSSNVGNSGKQDLSTVECHDFYVWRYNHDGSWHKRANYSSFAYKENLFPFSEAVRVGITLLSGFYLSKILCLKSRRRQAVIAWYKENELLTRREKPRYGCKKFIGKSFVPPDKFNVKDQYNDFSYRVVKINNDSSKETTKVHDDLPENDKSVEIAIRHLMDTIGNIEFQMGMQNIHAHDPKTAVSHFKLATSHMHAGATFNLGVCYELGIGIEKDMKKAMECYRSASSLGHKKAMYNLGVFYAQGLGGLKKSSNAALECFRAADKLGLKKARYTLDMPKHMRKSDDEIVLKSNEKAIDVFAGANLQNIQQPNTIF